MKETFIGDAPMRSFWQPLLWIIGLCLTTPLFAKKISIVTAEFPPFKYIGDNGKIIGLDTEIIEQVFQRMGYQVDIKNMPFKRADQMTRDGEFAAYYTFTYNDERGNVYLYTSPISAVQNVFFYNATRKDTPAIKQLLSGDTLDVLKNLNVGVSADYNYDAEFMALWQPKTKGHKPPFKPKTITGSKPVIQHLDKLVAGRIDTFISEVSVTEFIRNQDPTKYKDVAYVDNLLKTIRTFHMAFSKKWRGENGETPLALRDHFNFELAQFIAEGGREKIFAKYGFVSPFKPRTNIMKSQ